MPKSLLALVFAVSLSGCTSFPEYIRNGLKVGPNYCPPGAAVAKQWIDADDIRLAEDPSVIQRWWTVFDDSKLNFLVDCAYRQNLSLREAGLRILQARAQRDIVVGNIFPQSQTASGGYGRRAAAIDPNGGALVDRFTDSWNFGFNLNWELDFWGRFRRAVAAANADLDASVDNYDDVLVTLLADVAENYVTVRTTEKRIELLKANIELQQGVLQYITDRFQARKVSELDLDQSVSDLRQTEAGIPQLEIAQRQAENRLCILLGMPPANLRKLLGEGAIPTSPSEAAIGIPADLLRRRPDVRKAEREAAAQAEEIGIAEADLYPAFYLSGSFGYSASKFSDLFRTTSLNGNFGPSFSWNLLNYGRIVNNVRLQDARFRELIVAYRNTVLLASEEVENGLVNYLRSQRRAKLLDESVEASRKAVEIVILQYKTGRVDFNRYATIQQSLVTQQDSAAQARGQISQGLIEVYRALGGGWEIDLAGEDEEAAGPGPEVIRLPNPTPMP
ncbi:MAG: TolC family protein [Pirellulales bacterium]|nr:TolC family protein [Pirellulales bacterium]